MSEELFHECGIAAVYHFGPGKRCPLTDHKVNRVPHLIPRMLQDMQNRGQLAAGMTTLKANRDKELLRTHRNVGSVADVFKMARESQYKKTMKGHKGPAAIGHVRYATCGKDDPSYAQPFERTHLEVRKWFSFGFNGQLANYADLRHRISSQGAFHLSRETDTETIMHLMSQIISDNPKIGMKELLQQLSGQLDGAWNIVFLDASGNMFVSRDPVGFRPLCYAVRDGFFAAASESVALSNLGFKDSEIEDLAPGHAAIIENGELRIEKFADAPRRGHCFFEWVYFSNVCSKLDGRSVYLSRKNLGEQLARQELEQDPDFDRDNAIVVPVPDTARSAAEGMAFELGVPCLEGVMRHRALTFMRTFIASDDREAKARMKYIPLPDVLKGKKIYLVDDTIVRSTTMKVLVEQIKKRGRAAEVHIRIACPPIMGPCFYGIDMPDIDDLFAPKYVEQGEELTPEIEAQMAQFFKAESLRYLPISAVSEALRKPSSELCQACLNHDYPTPWGQQLYQLSLAQGTDETGVKQRLVEGTLEPVLPPTRL